MSNHFSVSNAVEIKQLWISRNIFDLVTGRGAVDVGEGG